MNMRTTKYLTLAAAALLLLPGCNKALDPANGELITVKAGIGTMTKVATDGAASTFETGDKIAVYAWTGDYSAVPAERVVDGVVNTLGGDGKWTPASQMRWKPGTDVHYFLGISPARTVSDYTADAFTLSGTYASDDLLIARNLDGLKPGSGAVALKFAHAMARLTVNVKVRNEFGASPAVSVSVTAKSGATVNYLTQAVAATGDAAARSLTATASSPTGYTHSFDGIQVPQTGVRTVTLTVAGKDYVYEAGEDIPLQSGHHTTLGLVLGKDKLELSGVSVSGWTDGSDLSGTAKARINGHEFVDMGSGLLWATCNVGAENPWDYGDYFAWGETEPKDIYNWGTYKFNPSGDGLTFTKYTTPGAILEASDDAATANWGGTWRMPSDAEWAWLLDENNCTWTKTTQNGVTGMLVTSKVNGNEIFLPAAGNRYDSETFSGFQDLGAEGDYWSSSLDAFDSFAARYLYFNFSLPPEDFALGPVNRSCAHRLLGLPVRPVSGAAPALGDLYYSDGSWSTTRVEGKTPIGVIAYLGTDAFTETGTFVGDNKFTGHGLVLSLKNAASGVCWSTETGDYEFGESARVDDLDALKRTTDVSGYTNTATLAAKADAATKYPAAWQARNYTGLPAPAGTTGWFLPSAQQWARMMTGLGGLSEGDITWISWFNNDHSAATAWETAMAKAGAKGTAYDSMTDDCLWYWSSSEFFAYIAVYLGIDATDTGANYGIYWYYGGKNVSNTDNRVRPVLAF